MSCPSDVMLRTDCAVALDVLPEGDCLANHTTDCGCGCGWNWEEALPSAK
uniref:Uncharacterized protein n=1 Tax=Zea mays TaxID=4577 RepID=C4J6I3_MAIZE|nr:unknown [Zea mays]